jgi:hypothetical protein
MSEENLATKDLTILDIPAKLPNQLVGNVGLFHASCELSKRGWNCLPTIRNSKGPDIIAFSQDAKRKTFVQVKSLRPKSPNHRIPVPFGKSLNLVADYLVVCVLHKIPEVYILTPKEVEDTLHRAEKEGRVSYWLEPKSYIEHKDRWDKIGNGFDLNIIPHQPAIP